MGNRIEIEARRSGKALKTRLVVEDALRRGTTVYRKTDSGFKRVRSTSDLVDEMDAIRAAGRGKCLCSEDFIERVIAGKCACGHGGCPYGGDL